jgi:putative restriction endonuclease
MEEFDQPLFKMLAHNDTGKAAGHQGGIVIPKYLDEYFPQLSRVVTADQPTVDEIIRAQLFDGSDYLGTVETRYQFQTWGGTRAPERRITGNLGPLRNMANGGDLLLICRHALDAQLYQLRLVRKSTELFVRLQDQIGGRRWGPLDRQTPPASELEVEFEINRMQQHETRTFEMFDDTAPLLESKTKRVARSRAFQQRILEIYGRKCVVCDRGLAHPDGRIEPEAAHIVPRRLKGSDDARNGLLLCKSHHWAFDTGLFGISNEFTVIVSDRVASLDANATLTSLREHMIAMPSVLGLQPHRSALDWHRNTLLVQ